MKNNQLSRRKFIGVIGLGALALQLPFVACNQVVKPTAYQWQENELQTLDAVLKHIWPKNVNIPNLSDTNSLSHLQMVLKDKYLRNAKRKILRAGPKWVDEVAHEQYSNDFVKLSVDEKEYVLRELETMKNGGRFLNYLLTYHFEALLGDPAYGINKNETGWKWLTHYTGNPRPKGHQIYQHES